MVRITVLWYPYLVRWSLFGLILILAGCNDLRSYRGTWTGTLVADPDLGKGFSPSASLTLALDSVFESSLHGTLTSAPLFDRAPVESITRAAGDALSDLKVGSEPLRSYLGFAPPNTGGPVLAVVSLFPEERMELRLVRGVDELYGLFLLRRP